MPYYGLSFMKTNPIIAICYDFDGTLAASNIQEYGFIPKLGMSAADFWKEAKNLANHQKSDEILAYMQLMIKKATSQDFQFTKEVFMEDGAKVKLFKGVKPWFELIGEVGKSVGIEIEHYIISSAIREMIEGTSIQSHFKKIYASSFMYDQHNAAFWPAHAVNYTTKTQFIFRINKGCLDEWNTDKINDYVPHHERRVPFEHIIYLGDGQTDVPCMRLVKEQGGHSIAIYEPGNEKKKKAAEQLLAERRVNFVAQGDYSRSKPLARIVEAIIQKIAAQYVLFKLSKEG